MTKRRQDIKHLWQSGEVHWALPAALLISSLFFPGCDRSQGRVPELCLNLVPAIAGMWMSVCIRVCMCVHARLLRSCGCSMFWLTAIDCTRGLSVSYLHHCSDFILNCDILIKRVNKYIKIFFFLKKRLFLSLTNSLMYKLILIFWSMSVINPMTAQNVLCSCLHFAYMSQFLVDCLCSFFTMTSYVPSLTFVKLPLTAKRNTHYFSIFYAFLSLLCSCF